MHSSYSEVEKRRNDILQELEQRDKVYVKDLAEKFGVTTETIRRDLDKLESLNKLKKIFGGAIKTSHQKLEWIYNDRESINLEVKRKLAAEAASWVEDNDIVFLLAGSTVAQMPPFLREKKELTVVSNSVPIIFEFAQYKRNGEFDGRLIQIGGEFQASSMGMSGVLAQDMLKDITVNKAFFSCGGFTPDNISTFQSETALMMKRLLAQSRKKMLVADASKLGVKHLYKVTTLLEMDMIITDTDLPEDWKPHTELSSLQWVSI
ncbi:DeoR/GlpR family DNA-binding transcription regulator [Paenibacillus pabuli]|uniref:DeoR/GlpR family DNA-binding transcription regulator n=1 Tax=Paenibacillus pabuli TaxID=1472 RepID=UPI001FFE6290|nr:DeoR/GlpR family DNA-binding transcription regulator [Paenibacillus pabuli]UPK41345.1 DeoR/GlpR transcriptional regulator [Paenibacillus pabuli]